MREREEIGRDFAKALKDDDRVSQSRLLMDVVLDIRDSLILQNKLIQEEDLAWQAGSTEFDLADED